MSSKKAYFQGGGGVNEPTPKKKKYKSEPAILVQPRFKEPFYRNYDLYETEGVNGPAKHGPGAGWHDMKKYKSLSDFIKDKRKKLKDKYKADDSWIQDDGSISKKEKRAFRRMALLSLIKNAIDFAIDDQISEPILGDSGTYSDSVPIGGITDEYLTPPDFENKSIDQLNHHHDYVDNEMSDETILNYLENKYINTGETGILGLPDGVNPMDDEDMVMKKNPLAGITDSGNTLYDKISY
jgi:hypothetical protein